MKIAVCSDELYPVNEYVVQTLEQLGHHVVLFGALKSHQTESWVKVARAAAESIIQGTCDEGIFFCWSGTGISIAANKIPGIRAALCTDAQTARGARLWNRANVLALSNRLLTQDLAKEILASWFDPNNEDQSGTATEEIRDIEAAYSMK